MQGKMKIKGSMAAASKFTPELFPQPTPENMVKYSAAKLWFNQNLKFQFRIL